MTLDVHGRTLQRHHNGTLLLASIAITFSLSFLIAIVHHHIRHHHSGSPHHHYGQALGGRARRLPSFCAYTGSARLIIGYCYRTYLRSLPHNYLEQCQPAAFSLWLTRLVCSYRTLLCDADITLVPSSWALRICNVEHASIRHNTLFCFATSPRDGPASS